MKLAAQAPMPEGELELSLLEKPLPTPGADEVLIRIATLDGIQPTALKDLNEVMSHILAGGERMKKSSLGGAKTAAEIINMMGSSVEATSHTSR